MEVWRDCFITIVSADKWSLGIGRDKKNPEMLIGREVPGHVKKAWVLIRKFLRHKKRQTNSSLPEYLVSWASWRTTRGVSNDAFKLQTEQYKMKVAGYFSAFLAYRLRRIHLIQLPYILAVSRLCCSLKRSTRRPRSMYISPPIVPRGHFSVFWSNDVSGICTPYCVWNLRGRNYQQPETFLRLARSGGLCDSCH